MKLYSQCDRQVTVSCQRPLGKLNLYTIQETHDVHTVNLSELSQLLFFSHFLLYIVHAHVHVHGIIIATDHKLGWFLQHSV